MAEFEEGQGHELTPEELEALIMARKRHKRRPHDEPGELAINSLMDIMTILLVFLLITVTSDPLAITENNTLKLTRSSANFPAVYSTPITVTKKEIVVDRDVALNVSCRLDSRPCSDADLENPGAQFSIDQIHKKDGKAEELEIVPLKEALESSLKRMKEQNMQLKKEVAEKYLQNQHVVTIICDRDIPYRLVAEVVHTAGMAKLHDIRFAIVYSDKR